ncbi:MAG TPA: hypothetical protein VGB42_07610 [Candidatus Thermoplasmatota archaeon]
MAQAPKGEEGTREDGKPEEAGPTDGARFLVGPGFEIAVRPGRGHPFDVSVNPSRRGPGRGGRGAADHGHPDLEGRIVALEASLKEVADALDVVLSKVDSAARAAGAPRRNRPDG